MPAQNQLATVNGKPVFLKGVSMLIPNSGGQGFTDWQFVALPEVSDSKEAQYSDIPILGRSSPIPTFSHSGYRKFQIAFHLHSITDELKQYHVNFIRAVASLVHPEYNNSYRPPRLAWFKCGSLIGIPTATGGRGYVRILAESYSYTMDPEYVWLDQLDLVPQYIALNINVRVVYSYARLPGADSVLGGVW